MTAPRPPAQPPRSTWRYEEGVLVVQHHGERISLGRYATREHAAHGGQQ